MIVRYINNGAMREMICRPADAFNADANITVQDGHICIRARSDIKNGLDNSDSKLVLGCVACFDLRCDL